jgi:hypothetical protein
MRAVPGARVLSVLTVGLVAALAIAGVDCKRSAHPRVASFTPPPMPAGFVEQTGAGWRIAVPSTWAASAQSRGSAWICDDPQPAGDYRANVNVVTEPYSGESYDYARANDESLRHEPHTAVEISREDVIDGDPTLVLESRWSPQGGAPYRTMQAFLSSRGTGYVVTCTAAVGAFERYRSTCDAIVRSFAVQR